MSHNISSLFEKIIKGDRAALGKAMTLVESELEEDRAGAIQLLELCQLNKNTRESSIRLAFSGAPGVGKSTLIEAVGLQAIKEGHKVGVITIDPTSNISHGSILGDKVRMPGLSASSSSFVRSSAAGKILGGIGRRSFEMMTILEAIGYDIIFMETVGVGQSEHIAWQLTDGFILIIQPGSGDELQGIKRGITELADIIVINKSDGSLAESAAISKSHYQNAIHYLTPLRHEWQSKVLTSSAITKNGIDEFWKILRLYINSQLQNNQRDKDRSRQNEFWLSWSLNNTAHQLLMDHPAVRQKMKEVTSHSSNSEGSVFTAEFEIEKIMKEMIYDPGSRID